MGGLPWAFSLTRGLEASRENPAPASRGDFAPPLDPKVLRGPLNGRLMGAKGPHCLTPGAKALEQEMALEQGFCPFQSQKSSEEAKGTPSLRVKCSTT